MIILATEAISVFAIWSHGWCKWWTPRSLLL